MSALLAEITWRPTVGDPDPLSWCITGAYLLASGFCIKAARHAHAKRDGTPSLAWYWWGVALFLLFLGLNKQLDLQTLLTQFGRAISKTQGWFSQRKQIQRTFVVLCAGIGLTCLAAIGYLIRRNWRDCGVAFFGVVLLAAFIVIRAASMNHVKLHRINGVMGWLSVAMEVGGSVLVMTGAGLSVARKKR
jgi:hypothetical protein